MFVVLYVQQVESDYLLEKEIVFDSLSPYTTYRLEVHSLIKRTFYGFQSETPGVLMITTQEDGEFQVFST